MSIQLGSYLMKNIFLTPIATMRRSVLTYRDSVPVVDNAAAQLLSLFRERAYSGDSTLDLLSKVIPHLCERMRSKNPFYACQRSAFSVALYLLTRSLRPRIAIETGVLWGFASLPLLYGMDENKSGSLFSIDLPARETILPWRILVGRAVPERLSGRWRLILGETRFRLQPLLGSLGEIDLFLHDSLHTYENMRFEMEAAWPHLRPGGLLIVDDIAANNAFADFVAHRGARPHTFTEGSDHFGVVVKQA